MNHTLDLFIIICETYKKLSGYISAQESFLRADLLESPLSYINSDLLDSTLKQLFPNIEPYEDDVFFTLYDFLREEIAQGINDDNTIFTINNYADLFDYLAIHNKKIGELK